MFHLKDKLQDLREGLEGLPSVLFSLSAALSGSLLVLQSARTIASELIPRRLQALLVRNIGIFISPIFYTFTFVIREYDGYTRNKFYDASELFLRTRITRYVRRVEVKKVDGEKNLVFTIDADQIIVDVFEGIEVSWRFIHRKKKRGDDDDDGSRSFELSFPMTHKDKIMSSYLPYVLDTAKAIQEENKILKLHTYKGARKGSWSSVNLDHPATFNTLAIDHTLKMEIIKDLDRFVRRKEFYKKVGKAWKRGYLLYGPPGTGKSSLIAAMANYLKFDIYDLELTNICTNSDLRSVLVETANRSILVIEDIDCSIDIQHEEYDDGYHSGSNNNKLTLSGLLNFIDGLWSSCGDERIIIFTTNHKDRLDPALLRPGRMDKHIHLSYCTTQGFNILASNYLGIQSNSKNKLYSEIEKSIEKSQVTPAEVAEELMKSDDPDIALGELIHFLKRKRVEQDEPDKDKDASRQPKKAKIVKKKAPAAKRTKSALRR